jgi:hypothetical protein
LAGASAPPERPRLQPDGAIRAFRADEPQEVRVNGKLTPEWLQQQATIYAARIRMANDLRYAEQAVARGETDGVLATVLLRPDGKNGGTINLVARPGFYRILEWFVRKLLPGATFVLPPTAPKFMGYSSGLQAYTHEVARD